MKKSSGFTLVELLVAISIISILGTVSISVFSQAQNNTRDTKRKAEVSSLAKSIEVGKDFERGIYKYDNARIAKEYPHGIPYSGPKGESGEAYCIKTAADTSKQAPADMTTNTFGSSCNDNYVTLQTSVEGTTANNLGAGDVRAWTLCARLESGSKPYCLSSATAKAPTPTSPLAPTNTPTSTPTATPAPTIASTPTPTVAPTLPPTSACNKLQNLINGAAIKSCSEAGYTAKADVNQDDRVNSSDVSFASLTTKNFTNNSICQSLLNSTVNPCNNTSFVALSGDACRVDFDNSGIVDPPDNTLYNNCHHYKVADNDGNGGSCYIYDVDGTGDVEDPDYVAYTSHYYQSCSR